MRALILVLTLGTSLLLGSQVLLVGQSEAGDCCSCGAPCPWRVSNNHYCKCCTCGVRAKVIGYNHEAGTGSLQIRNLHGKFESLNFTVPSLVRDKLKVLSNFIGDVNEHQLSLRFSGGLAKGFTVECFGVDENLPDRSESVRIAREALSILRHTPTHAPDHDMDKAETKY